ncbi:Golgin subfamily A member 7/ERF4 [Syncephalastrum racemosum]|uniref:Ras modification protein ERF4 n=1 Tax=Syncephalastrum racemosum TaxID=13706 RepID=A0A1X2HID6_SYNRA|nr:Golgin subfamily A member 7/ERF4 [Syncephalastrum racemosum]
MKINADELQATVETINEKLHHAEKLSLNIFDNVMECLTIYTWPMLFSTHYQRALKRMLHFIETENQRYQAEGVYISDPVRSAFLFVSQLENIVGFG